MVFTSELGFEWGMNSSNSSGLLETRPIFQQNKQEMVLIMGSIG